MASGNDFLTGRPEGSRDIEIEIENEEDEVPGTASGFLTMLQGNVKQNYKCMRVYV